MPTGLRILLVDDDPVLLKSLRDALESDGHDIVTANGGRDGIDTFREAHERQQFFSAVVAKPPRLRELREALARCCAK